MPNELCHCGQPLHYTGPETERIMREIVALHGIASKHLPTLGFEEITGEPK